MSNLKKIYLIGFMGSGKSTVGPLLAEMLSCNFIDLDLFIENKYGKTVKELFSENGEKFFRSAESDSLSEISKDEDNCVVSTGGGVVLSDANWEIMQGSGVTVYLQTGLSKIWERIKDEDSRPLLNVEDPIGEAKRLLEGRIDLYEKSKFSVNTDNLNAEQVAEEIIKIIRK